jgi:hypothetical protein
MVHLASTDRVVLVVFACAIGSASPGRAQDDREPATSSARPIPARVQVVSDSPTPSQTAEHARELERWVREYRKWQEWRHQSLKKGRIGLRDRKPQPQPPQWLAHHCRDSMPSPGTILFDACELLIEWNDDYATGDLRYQIAVERARREAPAKTSWWEHVHFDGFWPMMHSESRVVGMVGAHVTVAIEGRFQVFVAPGVMLLSVPTAQGTREWKPAADWGVAYRLFDFRVPLTGRPATFHVNFVRAWMLGNLGNVPFQSHVDLAGFSVTFKKPSK